MGFRDDVVVSERERQTAVRTRVARVVVSLVAVVAGFAAVTAVTGFPGPGALRRYPYGDLNNLADRANAEMDFPTTCPTPSDQPAEAPSRQAHPPAEVDVLRSRVRVPESFSARAAGSVIRSEDWEMFEGVSRATFSYNSCR